jgi:hypothetical protein
MSRFSADWLALREVYDARARNPAVLEALVTSVTGRGSMSIVDLACGSGATLRAVSSRLPGRQSWRLVDNDIDLLVRVSSAQTAGKNVTTCHVDLASGLELALCEPIDLVTTSALLDLVSWNWLDRLARQCVSRGLLFYAALTYDGRVTFEPADVFDAEIVEAVNRHQRRDKGFGPALGPTAGEDAIAGFKILGYAVDSGKADWALGYEDGEIQNELLAGWAAAAQEAGDLNLADIQAWLGRRLRHIASRRSRIRVGHVDFFARPSIGTR